jgi:hypothetical protein
VLLNRGDGSFEAHRDYATGVRPDSVAIGDLNGDGKPDLATANFGPDTVSVLLGRGDGSLQSKLDYRTGNDPESIVIGDVNGDGQPDLATADVGADTVSVLLNRGGGGFVLNAHYQTGSGPDSVAIGDLNGDGLPDLVTANVHTRTVSVLLNAGDGGFLGRRDYRTGGHGSFGSLVAIGDLNGDGKPDLAAAHIDPFAITVLLGRGDGTFAARREVTPPVEFGPPNQVAIGDMNGDHRPDLVTAGSGGVFVFVGRGDGRFQAPVNYRVESEPYSIAIGDLNGDRRPLGNDELPRLGAPQQAGPLHGAGRSGKDFAGREAGAPTRSLPRRQDPPHLLRVSEALDHPAKALFRGCAPGRRQGQPRRQPRAQALGRTHFGGRSALSESRGRP